MQDEELIERLRKDAAALAGMSPYIAKTMDAAAARLEALAQPVVGVEGLSMLSAMLDADIAREGPMASFMVRAGLLRDILDRLAALAASPSPVVGTTPGVNCPDCGHRLPVGYAGPCVACDAPCLPDLSGLSPVVGDREAIARVVREMTPGRCECVQYHKIYGVTEKGALEIADAILSLSTPVVGGGLPELLTAIDAWVADGTPETEQGILDARAAFPDPHTMGRVGMAQG